MKATFIAIAVIFVFIVNCNADDHCNGPNDYNSCKRNECCVKRRWPKVGFECEDKGDDQGDRCGGEYTCGCNSYKGYTCVPDQSRVLNAFREGTGSCQRVGSSYGSSRNN